jgi:hypothetical protein
VAQGLPLAPWGLPLAPCGLPLEHGVRFWTTLGSIAVPLQSYRVPFRSIFRYLLCYRGALFSTEPMKTMVCIAPQEGLISFQFGTLWCLLLVQYAPPAAPAGPKSWQLRSGNLHSSKSLSCQLFGPIQFTLLSPWWPLWVHFAFSCPFLVTCYVIFGHSSIHFRCFGKVFWVVEIVANIV